jgi:hypothetical protein
MILMQRKEKMMFEVMRDILIDESIRQAEVVEAGLIDQVSAGAPWWNVEE